MSVYKRKCHFFFSHKRGHDTGPVQIRSFLNSNQFNFKMPHQPCLQTYNFVSPSYCLKSYRPLLFFSHFQPKTSTHLFKYLRLISLLPLNLLYLLHNILLNISTAYHLNHHFHRFLQDMLTYLKCSAVSELQLKSALYVEREEQSTTRKALITTKE